MPPNLKRGQRDALDIIEAAEAQGWVRKAGGRSNSHIYLVPPNGGVPVGVACSPSDVHFRHQIIRSMRKSGFIWPPPPKTKVKEEKNEVLIEVIDAAKDQGWQVDQDDKTVTFRPPDPRNPRLRVDAKSPGINFFDLRNLKRSGLVWPWTPPNRSASIPPELGPEPLYVENPVTVPEQWKVMDWNTEYELSNAGRCRKIETGKLIYPDGAGMLSLTHKGRRQQKHLKGLVMNHFGHPPLKNVTLSDEPMGHRTGQIKAVLNKDNQENKVSAAKKVEVDTSTLPELEDGWARVTSVPEAIDGYTVSVLGEVRGPDGKRRSPAKIGEQLWVALRRFDLEDKTKSVRVDKLVLSNHVGPPPYATARPIHRDGNGENNALDNLMWPDSLQDGEPTPKLRGRSQKAYPKPVVVADPEPEVIQAEPVTEIEPEETVEGPLTVEPEEEEVEEAAVVTEPESAEETEVRVTIEPEPTVRRRRKKRQVAAAPKAIKKVVSPRGVVSGRFWQDEETGLVMYVYDNGVPEFPKAETPEEGRALLRLAALGQQWLDVMGLK